MLEHSERVLVLERISILDPLICRTGIGVFLNGHNYRFPVTKANLFSFLRTRCKSRSLASFSLQLKFIRGKISAAAEQRSPFSLLFYGEIQTFWHQNLRKQGKGRRGGGGGECLANRCRWDEDGGLEEYFLWKKRSGCKMEGGRGCLYRYGICMCLC